MPVNWVRIQMYVLRVRAWIFAACRHLLGILTAQRRFSGYGSEYSGHGLGGILNKFNKLVLAESIPPKKWGNPTWTPQVTGWAGRCSALPYVSGMSHTRHLHDELERLRCAWCKFPVWGAFAEFGDRLDSIVTGGHWLFGSHGIYHHTGPLRILLFKCIKCRCIIPNKITRPKKLWMLRMVWRRPRLEWVFLLDFFGHLFLANLKNRILRPPTFNWVDQTPPTVVLDVSHYACLFLGKSLVVPLYFGSTPPSNSGNEGLLRDSLLKMFCHPGGHYYWEGGQPNLYPNSPIKFQVIQSDPVCTHKWPFRGLSDLHLGNQKVTLKKLVWCFFIAVTH